MNITNRQRKYPRRLFLLVLGCFLSLLALVLLPYWPRDTWAFAALFNFAPHWLFALPAFLLAPLCWLNRQYRLLVTLFVALLLCVKLSGWVFNLDAIQDSNKPEALTLSDPLVVIAANMGYASYDALNQLIVENNADIVALAETSAAQVAPLLKISPLNSVCAGNLCLLSHLNLKLITSKTRSFLNYPGAFVMQVEVGLPASESQTTFKTFDFFVIHLLTPRDGFEALIANPLKGWGTLFDTIDMLVTESWIASNFVLQGRNPIAAGDFNLPRNNPIFAKYWGFLNDSFQESGNGLGYSKHTRWHGVQIDHILYKQGWRSQKTWTVPPLGGDHSPVISVLNQQ